MVLYWRNAVIQSKCTFEWCITGRQPRNNELAVHRRSERRSGSSRRDKQLRNGLLKKEVIRLAHIYVTAAQA